MLCIYLSMPKQPKLIDIHINLAAEDFRNLQKLLRTHLYKDQSDVIRDALRVLAKTTQKTTQNSENES